MSIKLMSLVWELSTINSELNRDDKFLLIALADHANDDGECYPSLSKIQKKCFFSRQGLINSINKIIKVGYVSKNKRARENGGNSSNLYQIHQNVINLKIEEAKLLENIDKNSQRNRLGVVNCVDKGSLSDRLAYEPSINHPFNLSLVRADLKTFKLKLIQFCPNYYFTLSKQSGLDYSEDHKGFCLKDGYIYNLHTNQLLDRTESFEIWRYLFSVSHKVFEQAKTQNEQQGVLCTH